MGDGWVDEWVDGWVDGWMVLLLWPAPCASVIERVTKHGIGDPSRPSRPRPSQAWFGDKVIDKFIKTCYIPFLVHKKPAKSMPQTWWVGGGWWWWMVVGGGGW